MNEIDARLDDFLSELRPLLQDRDGPLTTEEAGAYIRAAYGRGYSDAFTDEKPTLAAARRSEREAWARLPV